MTTEITKHPMVRLSRKVELTLYLIKEELKSRKFFNGLHRAGIDDCYYEMHLDQLIMMHAGLRHDSDKDYAMFSAIMEKRSKKITDGGRSVMKQALKVYIDLMIEKKRQRVTL